MLVIPQMEQQKKILEDSCWKKLQSNNNNNIFFYAFMSPYCCTHTHTPTVQTIAMARRRCITPLKHTHICVCVICVCVSTVRAQKTHRRATIKSCRHNFYSHLTGARLLQGAYIFSSMNLLWLRKLLTDRNYYFFG